MKNKISHIIIHHSASSWGTSHTIDKWHRERGFSMIGYHFVILNNFPTHEDIVKCRAWDNLDGYIVPARPLDRDQYIEDYEPYYRSNRSAVIFYDKAKEMIMLCTAMNVLMLKKALSEY